MMARKSASRVAKGSSPKPNTPQPTAPQPVKDADSGDNVPRTMAFGIGNRWD